MPTNWLQSALWLAIPIMQLGIVAVMLLRKAHRTYPVFFSYTLYVALLTFVMFALKYASYTVFFYSYWTTQAISLALGLAVIYEIFQNVFRRYAAIERLGELSFRWAGAMLLVVGMAAAWASPGSDSERVMAAILVTEQTIRIMQSGLLLLIFGFVAYFRLDWPHYTFGIALGFAIFTLAQVALLAVRVDVGNVGIGMFKNLVPLSYFCGVVIWTVIFVKKPAEQPAMEARSELERWNTSLLQMLSR